MSIITLIVEYGRVTVVEGRKSRARLIFVSAGLDVYQLGKSDDIHTDCIPNIAMNACIERHIPLISLRSVKNGKA